MATNLSIISSFSELSHPYLGLAFEAAQAAGGVLRDSFRKKVSIRAKSLANFVSEVDLKAESTIANMISRAFPTHEILGEEGVHSSKTSDQLWIVDPLDGTSNYLHGIPQFAVSIGFVDRNEPTLGVIYNPISEEWFATVKGQGAWFNGERMSVGTQTQLDEVMLAVGFYYDRGKMMEQTLAAVADLFRRNVHGVRRFGAAALDLAQTARGDFGAFMEFKLQPWDHAAGGLMIHEAGGRVTDCTGRALPLRTSSSILASNGLVHEAMLAIAEPYYLASQ